MARKQNTRPDRRVKRQTEAKARQDATNASCAKHYGLSVEDYLTARKNKTLPGAFNSALSR